MGGAPFNFIYHVWKILGKAGFISSVGDDENGRELLQNLKSAGFNTNHIYTDKSHPTGTVTVTLGKDKIPVFKISPECSYDHLAINESSRNLIDNGTDLLYFGTLSTRGEVSRDTIISLFGKSHLKYFCDLNLRHNFYTKELIERTLRTCNVLKLNMDELSKLKKFFGLDGSDDLAAEQLIKNFGIDLIGLTLGSGGSILYNRVTKNFRKAEEIDIIDTLGAGDAYSAVLALGYLRGWEIGRINKIGSEFAGGICTVEGALPAEDSFYKKFRSAFALEE